MVVSISDHGRGIKALSDTVSDLLTQTSAINTSIKGQAKQLTDLQALVTSFRDQVFSIQEREEPQAGEVEPSPVVEETHTEHLPSLGQEGNHERLTIDAKSQNHDHHLRKRKTGLVSADNRRGNLLPVLPHHNQGKKTPRGEKEGLLHLHPPSTFLRKFA
jgi:hypothetical protein